MNVPSLNRYFRFPQRVSIMPPRVLGCMLFAVFPVVSYSSPQARPAVAITLRPSILNGPTYPLLPLDVTIEIQNLTSEPRQCAAFLFLDPNFRAMDLATNCRWAIWSPDGTERRVAGVGGTLRDVVVTKAPEFPLIAPGQRDSIRQVLRLCRYHDFWTPRPEHRPRIGEVFLFPKSGAYVTQLESPPLKASSNRLTIEVKEPVGRDREAYEHLLQSEYPYFASGFASPENEEERAEVTRFLAQYGDTVYAPYARFYLSLCDWTTAWQDLSSSGVVRNEDFLRVWDDLLADKNFRLWPWVLYHKAEYLEQLGTPQRRFDPATQKMVRRPIQRLGQILLPDQQEAIWQQGKSIRETLQREYPYFPD